MVARLSDPFCSACGMSLDEVRDEAELAGYLAMGSLQSEKTRRFRDQQRRAGLVRFLCSALAVVWTVIGVASLASVLRAEQIYEPARFDDTATLSSWDGRAQMALAVMAVTTALLFVEWATRAYRNLDALGVRGLRFGRSWAIWMWFVPFVNLVLPKEQIDDLWRASDPDVVPLSPAWRLRTVPRRVNVWWVSLLASVVLLAAAQWVLPDLGEEEFGATWIGLVLVGLGHLVAAVGAFLGAVLVDDVQSRQTERMKRLESFRPFDRLDVSLVAESSSGGGLTQEEPSLVHANPMQVWGRY
jgi:hypothetical protein